MFDPSTENDRQAAVRRDRPWDQLDSMDKLAWANAASTPAEIAAEQAAKAATEASYTPAQREFLQNKRDFRGIQSPDELDESDAETFEWLATLGKSSDESGSSGSAPAAGPLALDNEKLGASDLSPERKIAIAQAFNTLKRAEREAHLNPAVRRDRPAEIEAARLLVKPFLKR